ncbi:MAG: NnrS family protein [Polyangiaceae bacterium]
MADPLSPSELVSVRSAALSDNPTRPARRFAFLDKGFRPFFLLAGAFAALVAPLWLFIFEGVVAPTPYFVPMYWHAHEMIFGFAVAVIAGFLLTSVGNWTKLETATGWPLLALAGLWIAGRCAMLCVAWLPHGVAAIVDLAFLPALMVALGRPLVRSNNRRNFVMVGVLGALFLANLAMHLDALGVLSGWQRRSCIVGVDIVVLLILVITGRVLPMFTRNGTGATTIRSHVMLDRLTLGAMALLTLLDAALPGHSVNGIIAAAAAIVALARAVHWGTRYTVRMPLLWILHLGYLWIPVGLLLRWWTSVDLTFSSSLATHALTAGAIGSMTLGMMARVALGHTGRPLVASPWMTLAFALVTLAAVARVFGPMIFPASYLRALETTGVLWSAAFAIFVVVYAPIVVRGRVDGKLG